MPQKCDDGSSLQWLRNTPTFDTRHITTVVVLRQSHHHHRRSSTRQTTNAVALRQVAEELLKRGLSWCDGVVYLDDADKQQVLVRATGRAVPADQCGVPLERRFAFYDQVMVLGARTCSRRRRWRGTVRMDTPPPSFTTTASDRCVVTVMIL